MRKFHEQSFELPIVKKVITTVAHGQIKYHVVTVEVSSADKWLFANLWPFATITETGKEGCLVIEYLVKPGEVTVFLEKLSVLVERSASRKIALLAESRRPSLQVKLNKRG